MGRFLDCGLLEHGFARVRRAVLAEFVRRGWLEAEAAAGKLAWPHSGFGASGAGDPGSRGAAAGARYSARAPVAESRLR